MAKLTWDGYAERFYELGIDRGVLYVGAEVGVAWTGLVSITENISGGEPRPYYIDGEKYLNLLSSEEFAATLEAFACPAEFGVCDGNVSIHTGLVATQQPRKAFGLSYRTLVGNDVDGSDHAYKLHLVYNALAAPSQRNNTTLGGSSDPLKLSWVISTKPPAITGYKPTAHLVIDSRDTDPSVLSDVEDLLYGTVSTDPTLPLPDDLIALFTP
jgi:hypothetical protein